MTTNDQESEVFIDASQCHAVVAVAVYCYIEELMSIGCSWLVH